MPSPRYAEPVVAKSMALQERFTLSESRSVAPPTRRIRKECPECRTLDYGNNARCNACGCNLTEEPEISASDGRLLPYLFFGVAVGTLLVLAAFFYR